MERNPVRAGLVESASAFVWSSAALHCAVQPRPEWIEKEPFDSTFTAEHFTAEQWNVYLNSDQIGEAEHQLRTNTYTGRPCGSHDFVQWMEASLGRTLVAQPGGRPPKKNAATAVALAGQESLFE